MKNPEGVGGVVKKEDMSEGKRKKKRKRGIEESVGVDVI